MIRRRIHHELVERLAASPVVGLVGARQVGKTTLARLVARERPEGAVYLDLELFSDAAKLDNAETYLRLHDDRLVILDEAQRRPDLYPLIRALVDEDRRAGRFLLLGSASPDLKRQASESLAGRITYLELSPFTLSEVEPDPRNGPRLWNRGGFPPSYLAETDQIAVQWREDLIQTYLERDLASLGIRVPGSSLRRFWQMLAHSHGQLWNGARLATGLALREPTIRQYRDILEDTFMVRVLPPFHSNVGKRLVKAPKVYIRDSGLLHTLLRLDSLDDVLGHPILGASWEGWALEQVMASVPARWGKSFYRTHAGAEVDLVLEPGGGKPPIPVEFKYSVDPAPRRGFWTAIEDIGARTGVVVCQATERYPIRENVLALPANEVPRFDWLAI